MSADQHSGDQTGSPTASRAGTDQSRGCITWASNSPVAPTGYGQQTAQVITRLAEDGWEVAVAANYGQQATPGVWNGIKIYPHGFDQHSNDVVVAHAAAHAHETGHEESIIVTLYDTWVYKGPQWDTVRNILSWVPIDHTPIPPDVAAWCSRDNVRPVAMSKFGHDMLQQSGIDADYAPHAIEKTFRPTRTIYTPQGTQTGRQLLGIDSDRFVVMMNSANKGVLPNRKSFPEAFLAFAMFAQQHEDAVLYVHTEDRGAMGGINLHHLAQACGIRSEQIQFADQYVMRFGMQQETLAALYTAADVLLQPSMGEGFGIPAVEAQRCGTPVILSNATASRELAGAGWLVEGQPSWDAYQKSWLVTPLIPSILEALHAAYEARGDKTLTAQARAFGEKYDADVIYREHWQPIMEQYA